MTTFFITATDTNVGKTYITAYLLKLFLTKGYQARAIKPIETGFNYQNGVPVASDVHTYQQINPNNNYPPAYYFDLPASPHYSARLANSQIDIDTLEDYCQKHIEKSEITLIEGAGGLLVPFDHQHNFTHLIKRLNCPIILVVKNQLGAINQALTNIELCEFYGINIACIVMNQTDPSDDLALENIHFIKTQTDIPVVQIDNHSSFKQFVDKFTPIINNLLKKILATNNLIKKLNLDKNHLWHPYTSMIKPLKTYHVNYAEGKYIYVLSEESKPIKLLEGMGSWWAVNQGYNRDDLKKSAIKQINQFSHVMFGGLTHNPAIELGKTLLEILPNGLEHIFYADSGSVSVEVAIKMALQFQVARNPQKTKMLTPMGGYHGDTFGAMSVCDPINGMHSLFRTMLAEQIFIPRPNCPYNQPFDKQCLEPLKQALAKHQGEIAGIIIEPLVQGAGGMWFYHADYLRYLRKVCDEQDIVLIFDEIATGFGRTGAMFASNLAKVTPDIICLGKAITGGFMSFACTVTNQKIAHGISKNGNPFMHGPTFMGNPLACAVAKTAINSLQNSDWQTNVKNIEQWLIEGLEPCKNLKNVVDVRILGAIGVVEMHEPVNVQELQAKFIKKGVWLRPFGKLIYTMPHFNFNQADIEHICGAIYGVVTS